MSSEAIAAGTVGVRASEAGVPDSGQETLVVVLAALWQRRVLLVVLGVLALLLGYFGSWLLPPTYKSTTVLMPLDQPLISNTSFTNTLSIANMGLASTLGGGVFGSRTPGTLAIGILGSRQLLDSMVKRFNLIGVYKAPSQEAARGTLAARSVFAEDRQTGMILIIVSDHDPARARDLANGYVVELANLVNQLSTSSARRERIFLEDRLRSVKVDLDQSAKALSQFASHTATFNPEGQAATLAATSSRLQSELIEAQSQLSSLRTRLSDSNVQVRAAEARIGALQGQLNRLNGPASDSSGQVGESSLPTLRQLPLLGFTFEDLARRQKTNEALYESLARQYELAKVEEAKEIPPIKVLDPAELSKSRSWPNHSLCAVALLVLTWFVSVCWIAGRAFWSMQTANSPLRMFLRRIARGEGNAARATR